MRLILLIYVNAFLNLGELFADEVGRLNIKLKILTFLHMKMEDCDEV